MQSRLRLPIVLVALAVGPAPVLAGTPDGADLAAACTGCHGPGGDSAGAVPDIAGMPVAEFTRHMAAFRGGEGTIMNRLAPAYDTAATKALARYFAAQPAPAAP